MIAMWQNPAKIWSPSIQTLGNWRPYICSRRSKFSKCAVSCWKIKWKGRTSLLVDQPAILLAEQVSARRAICFVIKQHKGSHERRYDI